MFPSIKHLFVYLINLALFEACTIPAGSQLVQNPTFQAYVFLPISWTWDSSSAPASNTFRKISASIIGSTVQQASSDDVIKIIDTDVRSVVKDVIKNMGIVLAGSNFSLNTAANEIPEMSLITLEQLIAKISKPTTNVVGSTPSTPSTKNCTECYVLENNSVKYYVKDITKVNPDNIFDSTTGLVPYSQLLTFKTTNTPLYYDFYWDIFGDRIRTALQNEGVIFDSTMKAGSNT
uniref:Secreted protein n=1 Tax=Strongyloides venezuelensis TaxID=75913 RepID=A0A0K0FVE5_STRVS